MENNSKIYIVSFGDSEKYRLPVLEDNSEDHPHDTPLVRLENELNSYLKERFPEDTFAYFTTPKVTEISALHADQYASYPMLDDAAVEEIKKVLVREIEVMQSEKQLDSDAPWSNI